MRYVCPENGATANCPTCRRFVPHKREEWVTPGQKVPTCDKHKLELIRADATP